MASPLSPTDRMDKLMKLIKADNMHDTTDIKSAHQPWFPPRDLFMAVSSNLLHDDIHELTSIIARHKCNL